MLAVEKCTQLWNDMRKVDLYTGGIFSQKLFEEIYEKNRDNIEELLKIKTFHDFWEVFDEDNDGYLNEDDQILIFSTIKERMQRLSNELCKIQEYSMFKELMREVRLFLIINIRKLEQNIAKYQNLLRENIYKGEMNLYHEIGQQYLDEFYEKYDKKFERFSNYKKQRIETLKMQHLEEVNILENKISKPTEMVKFKPKKKLKEYQTQEKLVSIDERVEEATNFRKELKNLEVSEKQRVENMILEKAEKQRRDLGIKQDKEMKQTEIKLNIEENNLIIEMKKEFDVLTKKKGLHENDIQRIQGITTKYAMKRGLTEGELKRKKSRAREQNDIIGQTKQIQKSTVKNFEQTSTLDMRGDKSSNSLNSQKSQNRAKSMTKKLTFTNAGSIDPRKTIPGNLKEMIKTGNFSRFYIRQQYGVDLPVNIKNSNGGSNFTNDIHYKLEKYIVGKKKDKLDILPSLTSLYDQRLNPNVSPIIKKEICE